MGLDFCNETERLSLIALFRRDMDIKPLYKYLCPVIIFVCFFSIIFNAILMSISRQSKFINKSPILLLSLNLAVTDLIASLLNGLGILFNSYLPEVFDIKMGQCSMLMFEVVRCAALIASALHLLALAFVHYRGIVNPLHYRSSIFFSQHLSRAINIISIFCWLIPLTIMIVWFSSTPCQGFQTAECDYLFLLGSAYRYMVLSVFLLPLVLMSIIYVRIFLIISRHQRGRRIEHERSTLTRGVISVTGPIGSAAAVNLPELMSKSRRDSSSSSSSSSTSSSSSSSSASNSASNSASASTGSASSFPPSPSPQPPSDKCPVCLAADRERRAWKRGKLVELEDGDGAQTVALLSGEDTSPASTSPAGGRGCARTAAAATAVVEPPPLDQGRSAARLPEGGACWPQTADKLAATAPRANGKSDQAHQIANAALAHDSGGNLLNSTLLCDDGDSRLGREQEAAAAAGHGDDIGSDDDDYDRRSRATMIEGRNNDTDTCGRATGRAAGPAPDKALVFVLSAALDGDRNAAVAGDITGAGAKLDRNETGAPVPLKTRAKNQGPHSLGPRGVSLADHGVKDGASSGGGGGGHRHRRARQKQRRPPRETTRTKFGMGSRGAADAAAAAAAAAASVRADSHARLTDDQKSLSDLNDGARPSASRRQRRTAAAAAASKRKHHNSGPPSSLENLLLQNCTCDNKLRQGRRQAGVRLARANTVAFDAGQTSEPGPGSGELRASVHASHGTGSLISGGRSPRLQSRRSPSSPSSADAGARNNGNLSGYPKIAATVTNSATTHSTCASSAAATTATKTNSYSLAVQAAPAPARGPADCLGTPAAVQMDGLSVTSANRTTINNTAGIVAPPPPASQEHEPTRRHVHASAVPQTNTKALITTLLILGTYFVSYAPAIIYQVLTCIDHCPYPLYDISYGRRVLFGAMTTLLLIAKSIVDPLIYSYRMSEIQVAISRYLSKRRSKTSSHATSMRTSQRFTFGASTNGAGADHQDHPNDSSHYQLHNHHHHHHHNHQQQQQQQKHYHHNSNNQYNLSEANSSFRILNATSKSRGAAAGAAANKQRLSRQTTSSSGVSQLNRPLIAVNVADDESDTKQLAARSDNDALVLVVLSTETNGE